MEEDIRRGEVVSKQENPRNADGSKKWAFSVNGLPKGEIRFLETGVARWQRPSILSEEKNFFNIILFNFVYLF